RCLFMAYPDVGATRGCRGLEVITGPTVSNPGIRVCSLWALTVREASISSITAAIALENPVAVKTSRSNKRGDAKFLRYNVKLPSRFPLRFSRLKVKVQFVSDNVIERSQKK